MSRAQFSDNELDELLAGVREGKQLHVDVLSAAAGALEAKMIAVANVVDIAPPVAVVGDVHGSVSALREVFAVAGPLPDISYVFLGAYVNRGPASVAVMAELILCALRWPARCTLLRSGHETRAAAELYGLRDECMDLYGDEGPYEALLGVFNVLPIAATLGSVLVLHGGLSPSIESLDQLAALDRFMEIPPEGALTDLMWSMPASREPSDAAFSLSPRGLGYTYSEAALDTFLAANSLTTVITGNSLVHLGFAEIFPSKLYTVWSVPNYLGRCGNLGAVVHVLAPGAFVPIAFPAPSHHEPWPVARDLHIFE
ncbi:uncharacterized protein AMSG_03139 [Thecamonas trahens ATCC 50062]|uniref:protein-serine/threonine phosphatase n=1 Tax=Thecamonas trahens ATCC 50062 TaxID=461836 RepID=A0A0L0D2Z4_THETB|nr:hypothetical protein AMSG_03139 [Thecamonas trahens ATCC 50062]KNC46702.1 hypothetical protein AMSG_03139 [Thecamonas trahens ATCC 50062]|eukprot:XP_013760468.1 hypothetical protein AMSG_03139 [Thecamonas trahens ATCC 50062]